MTKTKAKTSKGSVMPTEAQSRAQAEEIALDELIEKYDGVENPKPHLECRIFRLPDYCSIPDLAMRELDGQDDILSAYWADQNADAATKDSHVAASIADQREGIRLALVGVNGVQVNDDGGCYYDCDEWTSKTWRFLIQFFSELNGVSGAELKNAVRGSAPMSGRPQGSGASHAREQEDE